MLDKLLDIGRYDYRVYTAGAEICSEQADLDEVSDEANLLVNWWNDGFEEERSQLYNNRS